MSDVAGTRVRRFARAAHPKGFQARGAFDAVRLGLVAAASAVFSMPIWLAPATSRGHRGAWLGPL